MSRYAVTYELIVEGPDFPTDVVPRRLRDWPDHLLEQIDENVRERLVEGRLPEPVNVELMLED